MTEDIASLVNIRFFLFGSNLNIHLSLFFVDVNTREIVMLDDFRIFLHALSSIVFIISEYFLPEFFNCNLPCVFINPLHSSNS